MGWVFFEVALALAIAVGIVWWTIPRKRPEDTPGGDKPDDKPR